MRSRGSTPARISHPGGREANQIANHRARKLRSWSSINARGIASHRPVWWLTRMIEPARRANCGPSRAGSLAADVEPRSFKAVRHRDSRRHRYGILRADSNKSQTRNYGTRLSWRVDVALQLGCCDERAPAVFLRANPSIANSAVQGCAADSQNLGNFGDFESQLGKRLSAGHIACS